MRSIGEIFYDTLESLGRREFDIASWLPLLVWSALVTEVVLFSKIRFRLHFMLVFLLNLNITTIVQRSRSSFGLNTVDFMWLHGKTCELLLAWIHWVLHCRGLIFLFCVVHAKLDVTWLKNIADLSVLMTKNLWFSSSLIIISIMLHVAIS